MTNFIFKSQTTYKKLANTLQVILAEQRKQRADLQYITVLLKGLRNDKNLQKVVDDFYGSPPVEEENVIHPSDETEVD